MIHRAPIDVAARGMPCLQDAPCVEKQESGKGDEAPPCSPAGNIAEEPSPLSNPSWELFYHREIAKNLPRWKAPDKRSGFSESAELSCRDL